MGNKLSVCFCVNANEALGLGHLSRCRSLLLAFRSVGKCAFSFITDNRGLAEEFIGGKDIAFCDLDAGRKFDVLIVDVPDMAQRNHAALRGLSDLIVCIDDDGPGFDEMDVMIRPNLLDLPRPAAFKGEYWGGTDCIILHPDFSRAGEQGAADEVKRIMVCFGGSDPAGLTLQVAPLLKEFDAETDIIVGAAFTKINELKALTADCARIKVHQNVSSVASALRQADMALISGGTLLYEACSQGVPSIVICQNPGQEIESRICDQAGAVIDLGLYDRVSSARICETIRTLITDGQLRTRMSQKARQTVPINGAVRMVERIIALKGVRR